MDHQDPHKTDLLVNKELKLLQQVKNNKETTKELTEMLNDEIEREEVSLLALNVPSREDLELEEGKLCFSIEICIVHFQILIVF